MEKKWFIGIDISKKTLDVVLYNSQKKHSDETNYRKFSNDEEGYKELLSWCRSKYISCSQLVVGMETPVCMVLICVCSLRARRLTIVLLCLLI